MEREIGEKLIRELREQVNDLLAAAQLLTRLVREQGSERDEANLATLQKSLYCMVRTVDHMELCREEEPAFFPQILDLSGLCREVGRQVESVSADMGVHFTWEIEKEGVLTLGDDSLLETAILNLVSNAVKAAGQGGEVTLHCKVAGEKCLILVQDNGPGLAPGDSVADPLLKSGEGLGLGMEVVRRVAALHGGSLLLGDSAGDGVRAALSIPIRLPENGKLVKGPEKPPYDPKGGFSPLLVELAPLLPATAFGHKLLDQ
ncbi:MAG: HAMP domain-containing histidine kinase [Oscillospiraceae bacterium]|nr:HAMP domain-containing histidine kinase [Oscillospiraceae bacterium]